MPNLISIKDLKPGDRVDLEGDAIADPSNDKPLLANEFQVVESLEPEGDGCICVYFTDFTCGFPPDHQVKLAPAA